MEAQHHQQQYHYQYQTYNDANSTAVSLSYYPSKLQSYDQSTQSYYAYHYNQPQQQQQQQQGYSSYYYPDYSNSYSTHYTQNDPNSIHPPGISIPAETQQSHFQDTQNLYYQHGVSAAQPPPSQGNMLPGQSTYSNQGSQSTQSLRGGGSFGRQGRGRGGGRGKPSPGSSARTASVPGKPPPQKAWCELCKVDCNTLEILEQHKNGKKHKKNLKVHEELQNLTRQQATKNLNMPISGSNPENVASNKPEASGSEPAAAETKAEGASGKGENLIAKPSSGAPPSEKRKDRFNGRGGLKRSMRGGRGGKFMRAHDGSRKPVEPPKPKLGFPLICELCNVKCESQVVYESHIAGKKHLANAKRFQGQKEACGEGLQALYPTIPNVLSASVIPPQAYQQDPQDAQALASMMLAQQNLQDPQAVQATLTQLLNQHGIHDAQTLLIQLIPYLLAQSQVPGLVAAPLAGFGLMNAQNPQSQGVAFPAENGITESKAEQQNVADNAKIETVVANYDKSDDGKCLDESTKGLSESNTVEIENEGVLAKEEPTVS